LQITRHIHALKIPFTVKTPSGMVIERSVYVYLIYGKTVCLVDTGVAGSGKMIFDYIERSGRRPEEIFLMVLTHSHPDHIGGAQSIKEELKAELRRLKDNLCDLEDMHSFAFNKTTVHIGAEKAQNMQIEFEEECRMLNERIAEIEKELKEREAV